MFGPFQARQSLVLQVIYSYNEEGGIAKMLANHLGMTSGGGWMLPVWREMGGQAVCNTHPELHGAAGVLLSDDQAGHPPSLISNQGRQSKKTPKTSRFKSCYLLHPVDVVRDSASFSSMLTCEYAPTWSVQWLQCLLTCRARYVVQQGMSWNVHNISLADGEKPTWLIEGAVASIGGRSWLQVFRTTAGFMYSSRSDDDGVSWTPATPTHVRNPNSKARPLLDYDMSAFGHQLT